MKTCKIRTGTANRIPTCSPDTGECNGVGGARQHAHTRDLCIYDIHHNSHRPVPWHHGHVQHRRRLWAPSASRACFLRCTSLYRQPKCLSWRHRESWRMCQEKVSGSGVSRVRSSGQRTRTAPALASFLHLPLSPVLERGLAVDDVHIKLSYLTLARRTVPSCLSCDLCMPQSAVKHELCKQCCSQVTTRC